MRLNSYNSVDKIEYILWHILWIVVSFTWYDGLLFRRVNWLDYRQSRWVLFVGVILACVTGILFTIKRHRNGWNVIVNILSGYGVYTVLSYWKILPGRIILSFAVCMSFTGLWICALLCRKIKNQNRREKIIKGRIIRAVFAVRNGLCAAMTVIMAAIVVKVLIDGTISSPSVEVTSTYGEEYKMANNMDSLVNIVQEKWEKLSVPERLDICQVIANVEANYLGISHELYVELGELAEDVYGHYEVPTQKIVISAEHIINSPAQDIVKTVCHESYHCYQFSLIDLYNNLDENNRKLIVFSNIKKYIEESENYISGDEDYEQYYFQQIEADARKYARDAVSDYYERVYEYLGVDGGTDSETYGSADSQTGSETYGSTSAETGSKTDITGTEINSNNVTRSEQ